MTRTPQVWIRLTFDLQTNYSVLLRVERGLEASVEMPNGITVGQVAIDGGGSVSVPEQHLRDAVVRTSSDSGVDEARGVSRLLGV